MELVINIDKPLLLKTNYDQIPQVYAITKALSRNTFFVIK